MNPEFLIDGILRGVLGGRRKRSRRALRYITRGSRGSTWMNAGTLLTAAGVAWGIFDTLQGQGSPGSPGSQGAPPPIPNVSAGGSTTTVMPADAMRLVRLAISAANADGTLSEIERSHILEQARVAGAEALVDAELQQRRSVRDIVAGVTDQMHKATLYVLAFAIVRADETVSGAERIYLAQLANQLGLDPATVKQLEDEASARIDKQND